MKATLLLIIFWLNVSGSLFAQNLTFEKITTENGLNHNSVNCFLNCSMGYLWIGTFEGLNRYDGYNMFSYRPITGDSTSLSNNFIECIYEDRQGNIWIGTQNGLNRYHPQSDSFKWYLPDDKPGSVAFNIIKDILQDSSGRLWIATYGGGLSLYDYDTDSFTTFNTATGSDFMNTLFEDHNKTLWIGTWQGGLVAFDQGKEQFHLFLNPGNPLNQGKLNTITTIIEKQPGTLWLGTWENGIQTFSTSTGKFSPLPLQGNYASQLKESVIRSIIPVNNHETFIGTFGNGLFYLNQSNPSSLQIESYTYHMHDQHALSSNAIWDMYIDKSGLGWVATWGEGINKIDFNKNKFRSFYPSPFKNNWFHHNFISAILELEHPLYLLGTIDGGYYFFNHTQETFLQVNITGNPGIAKGITRLIKGADDNDIWIGTHAGLYRHDIRSGRINAFRSDAAGTPISGNEITALMTDTDKNIWVGVRGAGIDKLVPSEQGNLLITRYWEDPSLSSSISSNTVTDIYQDHHGTIWLATLSGGINIYNQQHDNFRTIIPADKEKGTETRDILHIYENTKGVLWIGTLSNGLWRYNRQSETFHSFSREDGLPANSIYGIIEDKNSNLWVTTGNGISRFNPVSRKFSNYFRKDGLHDNILNIDIYHAMAMTSTGELVIGGKNGFTLFTPSDIIENPFIPQVTINRLMINGRYVDHNDTINKRVPLHRPLPFLDQLVLTPHEQVVTLEFTSLHFASPQDNLYEYMLEGFDKQWTRTAADRRFATYTNLPAGEYIFRVRASNSDGVWHESSIASLFIRVKPAFWRTPWFILLVLSPFILAAIWVYRSNRRYRRRENEIRLKIVEAQQILNEKQAYKLEQERLSFELEKKNKELASGAVSLAHKNEKLKLVKEFIHQALSHSTGNVKEKLVQMNNIMADDLLATDDWEDFERNFDIMHDDFLKRFTREFPNVTHKDLKMVSYIRMNYSNKEIADLLNISLRSLESSRYRLRKKMGTPIEINLNDFIIRF